MHCVCACVCVCVRERERVGRRVGVGGWVGERDRERERILTDGSVLTSLHAVTEKHVRESETLQKIFPRHYYLS